MDIENLKLILETVKGVSGDVQLVVIWWLVLDKLVPVLAFVLVLVLALLKLPPFFCSLSDCYNAMIEFRNLLKVGSFGALSVDEITMTTNKIRDLIKKETT